MKTKTFRSLECSGSTPSDGNDMESYYVVTYSDDNTPQSVTKNGKPWPCNPAIAEDLIRTFGSLVCR